MLALAGHAVRVEEIILGHGDEVVTLGAAVVTDLDDPYAGVSFVVQLRASGMKAERTVFTYTWSGLPSFFDDLAEAWRGWSGLKVWESPEHDLRIEATFASNGHAYLRFTARNGPLPTWEASVEVDVEAGEEMSRIAREVASLLPVQDP